MINIFSCDLAESPHSFGLHGTLKAQWHARTHAHTHTHTFSRKMSPRPVNRSRGRNNASARCSCAQLHRNLANVRIRGRGPRSRRRSPGAPGYRSSGKRKGGGRKGVRSHKPVDFLLFARYIRSSLVLSSAPGMLAVHRCTAAATASPTSRT